MCSTSLGFEVVPEGSSAGNGPRCGDGLEAVLHGIRIGVVVPAVGATHRDPQVVAGTSANFGASAALATTALALPRSTRSRRYQAQGRRGRHAVTAPSLATASIVSHSSTWLPSMRSTWSPRRTPRRLQPHGDLVGAPGHRVEADVAQSRPPRRSSAVAVVAAGDGVEPVDGPVEPLADVGPAELAQRRSCWPCRARACRACRYAVVSGCSCHRTSPGSQCRAGASPSC